jgi:cytochrome bd-type quinol oxidase subunit 2
MRTFSIWEGLVVLVVLLIVMLLYFLPAFIAFRRRHRNRVAILVMNIFLGFTGIGWVVALIWAFTADIESEGGESETDSNRPRPRVPPTL